MLYGAQLKLGETVRLSPEDGGEMLHISQVCLVDPKNANRTYVQLNDGKKSYCIAVLQKDKCEHASLDLFVSTLQDTSLSLKGAANEVHLIGYFEPEADDDDCNEDDMLASMKRSSGMDEESEDEDDDEEEEEAANGMRQLTDRLRANGVKPSTARVEEIDDEAEEDDEDDDEGDEDEEDEVMKLMEGESGEEDEDEEEEEEERTISSAKTKAPQTTAKVANNKQSVQRVPKRENDSATQQRDTKKQKKQANGTAGGATDSFQTELMNFLTAHGRTNLGMLGQKVKKPASITEKLGQFVKERPSVFALENGFVTLVK